MIAQRIFIAIVAAAIGCCTVLAQSSTVSSLTVGTGTSAMTILPPTGLTQPFTLDLSALASIGDGQTVQLSMQRVGGALQFVANAPTPVVAKVPSPDVVSITNDDGAVEHILAIDDKHELSNDAIRIPNTNGLIVHVERVSMPKYFEYEQHTFRISIPGALKGAVVMASPQSHLPSGFVVNYATCIEDGVVELRVANLTVDCIQPDPTTFSFAVINATASRR